MSLWQLEKRLKTRLAALKTRKKITSAMEMVAASKMRRAQDRMAASKPFADRIRAVVGHIANADPEYQHEYLAEREVKRVAYIVVSTDRGLCGGLNVNLFKQLVQDVHDWKEKGVEVDYCAVGTKSQSFFRSVGGNILASVNQLGDTPEVTDLIGTIKVVLDAYLEEKIDRLFIIYNEFVNTMSQSPVVHQLLPLKADESDDFKHHWDYIYEPDAKEILDSLLVRFIESQVYQAVVENNACEQSARMMAMKNASDNAGELIKSLQLVYNKARQAAITQEISEIVGGAAAV